MSEFGSVRSLERGLDILVVINKNNGAKAAEIARATNIPRPTVYRLLETLEGLGFIFRDHTADKWRASLRTKLLSSGFRDEDWVSLSAMPEMTRLTRDILWPLDLVVFRDFQMVIRESTHNISPYSIDHGMVGVKLPVLETSGGRAYLAFSSDQQREETLSGIEAKFGLKRPFILKDGPLEHILEKTCQRGIGFRVEDYIGTTMSMSAPIFHQDRVISCLTIILTSSALKFDKGDTRESW